MDLGGDLLRAKQFILEDKSISYIKMEIIILVQCLLVVGYTTHSPIQHLQPVNTISGRPSTLLQNCSYLSHTTFESRILDALESYRRAPHHPTFLDVLVALEISLMDSSRRYRKASTWPWPGQEFSSNAHHVFSPQTHTCPSARWFNRKVSLALDAAGLHLNYTGLSHPMHHLSPWRHQTYLTVLDLNSSLSLVLVDFVVARHVHHR